MDFLEIIKLFLACFGGSTVALLALSKWLGNVWANRIIEKEKAEYSRQLEAYKNELEIDRTNSLKQLELNLNRQLEAFKSSLTKEVELLKISQTQLHLHKTQEFVNLVEYFGQFFAEPEKLQKTLKSPKDVVTYKMKMYNLGVKTFFFASDSTIEKYLQWKGQSSTNPSDEDAIRSLQLYGELMVSIRKDLGYEDTSCTSDDFLRIIINDWMQFKQARALLES
jgi:hypothetical protein